MVTLTGHETPEISVTVHLSTQLTKKCAEKVLLMYLLSYEQDKTIIEEEENNNNNNKIHEWCINRVIMQTFWELQITKESFLRRNISKAGR